MILNTYHHSDRTFFLWLIQYGFLIGKRGKSNSIDTFSSRFGICQLWCKDDSEQIHLWKLINLVDFNWNVYEEKRKHFFPRTILSIFIDFSLNDWNHYWSNPMPSNRMKKINTRNLFRCILNLSNVNYQKLWITNRFLYFVLHFLFWFYFLDDFTSKKSTYLHIDFFSRFFWSQTSKWTTC